MKTLVNKLNNEEGSVMVIAIVILVFLTLVGITATNITETEERISGSHLFHKEAFYHADSGVYTTPKHISDCLDSGAEEVVSGITYLGPVNSFYNELLGFDAWDADRDIRFTLGGFNVDTDVNRTGTQYLAGGGVEFASGAEGIGVGSAGGIAILYTIDSQGDGSGSAVSRASTVYRKVMGVSGGL